MSIYLEFTRLLLIFLWWMLGLGSPLHLCSNQLYNSTQKRMKHPEVAQWDMWSSCSISQASFQLRLTFKVSPIFKSSWRVLAIKDSQEGCSGTPWLGCVPLSQHWGCQDQLECLQSQLISAACWSISQNQITGLSVISQIVIRVWEMWRLLDS